MKIPTIQIQLPILDEKQIKLFVKREDTIHPQISGNKYRKLKYNLQKASSLGHTTLLTYGGAFSNHIAATAYAGHTFGFKTVGVIRGDELANSYEKNPTLKLAKAHGMQFEFVSRALFRTKTTVSFQTSLRSKFGHFYELPEGGTNHLAVKGCEEILTEDDTRFDVICSCVGTGGTLAGLINSKAKSQQVLGFPVLKGDFLSDDIRKFAKNDDWRLISEYHFGGYAKVSAELVHFINDFKDNTGIQIEPVYTGKLFFGLLDVIAKDGFKPGTKILAIHSGGLQGIAGMNELLKKKNLPLLNV
ncbi:pyridoxal-phosphate dependent enzyme [uncultured Croceitalea sp.]|uniref:1-aminocyclopropane-1-carboxylate deaminase/D-cysteine desulfhydrase n=1 Tax=uncultured Croceitalea sp. TaxID=1798908 RepID=UPI0033057579